MSGLADHESDVNVLNRFRRLIDALDQNILKLLGERFDVARAVAEFKRDEAIPMMQSDRVTEVHAAYLHHGAQLNLPGDFSTRLCDLLIAATCKMEDEIIDAPQQDD